MEIVRLRGVYQNLEKKNKELESKIDDLTLKNNHLSKENISLKYSRKELPKQNNNANDQNKITEELNKKITKLLLEKNELEKNNKQLKNINNELNSEKNDLEKKLSKSLKDIEMINRNMKELSEIKDNYRDKYQKINEELNNEKQIIKNLEKQLIGVYENNNNLYEDDSKIRTYRKIKKNKINEIELEKLIKIPHNSPQYNHKNISRFSTNNTYNTKKIYNSTEDPELSPENYSLVKQIQINKFKWYLFKKIKKNIFTEINLNQALLQKQGVQPLYRRYQYLKLNSKTKKEKEKLNEDSYSDFIWKTQKDEKDFNNFNLENINKDDIIYENEKEKQINELQTCIKELKDKLSKTENDCNRINLNYAKLVKRTKKPEIPYEKLLEENNKLKNENRLLNKKIEKLIENQKFIGISFIEDDLEGSKFIDDIGFENILEEITKSSEDKRQLEIITMKCFRSNADQNKENKLLDYESVDNKKKKYEKEINNEEKNIDLKENNSNYKFNKKILIKKENIKEILGNDINNKKILKKHNLEINEINRNGDGKIEEVLNEKPNMNHFGRFHKTIRNKRNINTEYDRNINTEYNRNINTESNRNINNISSKEKIYQKINPHSLNLKEYFTNINKTKNTDIEEENSNKNGRKTGFIVKRKYFKK